MKVLFKNYFTTKGTKFTKKIKNESWVLIMT
jgi:hypothetical protein